MIKFIFSFLIILFLNNCSVDTKSGVWQDKNDSLVKKKLSDIKFSYDITFEEFKENAIEYGKKSKYPKLDK
tara:strand:+ start:1831 stop:2043 length:213 start_codon:yes stop_codon:yes gene_type:complete